MARILATDDRREILSLIDRSLSEQYECELAESVEEAREKIDGAPFDLALCDIQMPGESGLVLAEEIVADHPDTAVVLVTGEDNPEIASRAFDIGVHGYLVKPFWPGQLRIMVMSALRRRELEISTRAHTQNLEERLQKVLDMAPLPIYVKDRTLRYIRANTPADELAGLDKGGLIGKTDDEIMPREDAEHQHESDRMVLEDGTTYGAVETLEMAEVQRTFSTVKFPLLDETGEVVAVCGISTDITDQMEAERLSGELAQAHERAIEELRSSRQETVERLVRAIELHDASTGEHVSRMASVAAFLGSKMGLNPERVELLRVAAPMHDVGKIATSDEILRKPGGLTGEERKEMERHTLVGNEILADSDSELLHLAATIALTHHERFDGKGYPQGLTGEEIPLEGRITAVADVFDALLSDRVYRPAFPIEKAVAIIERGRGTQFDPEIVDVLLDQLEEVLSLRG